MQQYLTYIVKQGIILYQVQATSVAAVQTKRFAWCFWDCTYMGRLVFVTITVENRTKSAPLRSEVIISRISAHITKMAYDDDELDIYIVSDTIYAVHCMHRQAPGYDSKLVSMLSELSRHHSVRRSAIRAALYEARA